MNIRVPYKPANFLASIASIIVSRRTDLDAVNKFAYLTTFFSCIRHIASNCSMTIDDGLGKKWNEAFECPVSVLAGNLTGVRTWHLRTQVCRVTEMPACSVFAWNSQIIKSLSFDRLMIGVVATRL